MSEQIVRIYDAPDDLSGKWVRQEQVDLLRDANTRLREACNDVLQTFDYLVFHRVAGMDGLIYASHNTVSPERTIEATGQRIRAALQPPRTGGADD